MQSRRNLFLSSACLLLLAAGCYPAGGLKHLAYQVSLIRDGVTTRDELVALMGPPRKASHANGIETLLFEDLNRSTGKRIPLLGRFIGHETHDLVSCNLSANVVTNCEYLEDRR